MKTSSQKYRQTNLLLSGAGALSLFSVACGVPEHMESMDKNMARLADRMDKYETHVQNISENINYLKPLSQDFNQVKGTFVELSSTGTKVMEKLDTALTDAKKPATTTATPVDATTMLPTQKDILKNVPPPPPPVEEPTPNFDEPSTTPASSTTEEPGNSDANPTPQKKKKNKQEKAS